MSDVAYYSTTKTLKSAIDFMSYVPLFGFKVEVNGNIPQEPIILAINHKLKILVNPLLQDRNKRTRWIDHLFVGALHPQKIHFMVQNIRYMKPATRKYLEELETFSTSDIRKGLDYLLKGETVGIFPEGEAHKVEEQYFYKGVAWFSARSERGIVPVCISKNTRDINNILHPKLNDIFIDYLPPLNPPKTATKRDLEKKVEEFKNVLISHKKHLEGLGRY